MVILVLSLTIENAKKYLKSFLAALCSHFSRNDKVLILRPEAIAEVYVQNYAYQLVVFASQEYSE